ncbi:hypothetical protein KBTX_01347 [wastewater metagenome]|uniref:Secretin/TonB short N-terminal domain-containing protein n=2 Tax=unclassified sequences TaxID=12908 RepID=A0A5B8RAR4_9ZZZZ|nr:MULTISPECIES: type IV pilus secretin PilQ [Arhodomonas]QEA05028.1 hypothetical protein KBTEX_01347 [uncultured organism]
MRQERTNLTPASRQRTAAGLLGALIIAVVLALLPVGTALAASLTSMDYATLSGDRVRVTFTFDGTAPEPRSFRTVDPARVALDFEGTTNTSGKRRLDIGVGAVEDVATAKGGNRLRAVIGLTRMVPYDITRSGNTVRVLLAAPGARTASNDSGDGTAGTAGTSTNAPTGARITKVDFTRGEEGAGRVQISLSDPGIPVDVERQGNSVIADFMGAASPDRLHRRLDVTDFATPVSTIETRQHGDGTRVTIAAGQEFEQVAYQADGVFTIEVRPFTPEEQDGKRKEKEYTGEKLSLNFQDIEVRSVLQLLADFTGLNMVVSDSVSGSITLRLQDVPWDQALDIILRAKGLDMRRTGNVVWVAPAAEIAERQRLIAEAQRQQEELAPLRSEFIQVNYAKATQLASLIRGSEGQSLLSERGSVTIDERTNTLIVQDTAANISDIRRMVNRLDIPVRQVLIESRVVIAEESFSHELGVQFGLSKRTSDLTGDGGLIVGGTQGNGYETGTPTGFTVDDSEGLMVDLPAADATSSLGLAVGKLGSYLLQLELSAMESEGRGQIISSPKVITANQKEAYIKQGEEIPYQESTSSGATNVEFKEAVLGLTVTPQITPDDRVLLDLEVSKDSRGDTTEEGPAIDTQAVGTQVLVDNGETVVLGGVYERTKRNDVERVPFFGELPVIGNLFRSRTRVDDNRELLIFVTPRILDEAVNVKR